MSRLEDYAEFLCRDLELEHVDDQGDERIDVNPLHRHIQLACGNGAEVVNIVDESDLDRDVSLNQRQETLLLFRNNRVVCE